MREEFDVYTEILQKVGYQIGRFGKGVWPSKHTFRKRDSFGERFKSIDEFLKVRKNWEPFCYWHGGQDQLAAELAMTNDPQAVSLSETVRR